MPGYNPRFLEGISLSMPKLTAAQKKLRAPVLTKTGVFELKYTHFSIVQNKRRRFAFYTATNIDGNRWNAVVKDRDDFAPEKQIAADHQTGNELYDFHQGGGGNDFDKGHITKFQDPQWGDAAEAARAAADTMRFVNCLPQHHTLNRGAWKSLEDYIVKKFTRKTGANGRKITVFAGPVLLDTDPYYVDKINGSPFQIPCFFWKVAVYPNRQGQLSAVAFLMSQRNVLLKHSFVVEKPEQVRAAPREAELFSDFTSGEPYQVRVDFIEQVTGFSFGVQSLVQPYTKAEATEIIYKRVEVPAGKRKDLVLPLGQRPLAFEYAGIRL